ncbi:TonB-dependent vitamin B12 receptor [Photobacterium indicum]|uniref:Vitamin B12 transporter BtuB n=1 Tax=Photobacterium indicum TaxID=81447 RepID=A0A2T3L259_9GAMM|nr:TonB-dependent vitamin B12 receptor [Photobacterium indicum]PSV42789.1 TonB-dependent vitamin B12 receptor [Photobacterium indicum]
MKKTLLAVALAPLCLPSQVFAADESSNDVMVVTANRIKQSTESVTAQVEVITRQDIDRIQAKSLTDVFRRLTGVQVTQNGGRGQNASLFVRGANSDQVLVLIDGVRFARAAKGAVDFSQVPITFVDRIEYVRGARASVYGSEAIGGVINIITLANSTTNDTTKVTAGLGSLDYKELSLSSGLNVGDNGHLNISLGYDADDGYNVHPIAGVNDGDRHGFESRNGLVGYVHNFSDAWKGFANLRLFNNISQYDGSFGTSHDQKEAEVDNIALASGGEYTSGKLSSQFQVNWQNQEDWNYSKSSGKNSPFASNDELEQLNLQWNAQYQLNQQVTLAGGLDWRDESYLVKTSNDKYDRDNIAYYGLLAADFEHLFGDLSIRLDDNEQFGSETTYNAGAGYRFSELLVVKASYGTSFKAPNLYQLYSIYGNQNLSAETADSLELTVSGILADVRWSVTGYDTRVDDLIDYNFSTSKYYNVSGESKLKGIEVVTEFETDFISHQLSADFKDPEDKDGEQLTRRAKEMFKYNATATFDLVDVSFGYQYVGERPDFSGELDAYSLFDVAANYYVTERLTLNARIDNLFDEEYETAGDYPAPERAYYLSTTYEF